VLTWSGTFNDWLFFILRPSDSRIAHVSLRVRHPSSYFLKEPLQRRKFYDFMNILYDFMNILSATFRYGAWGGVVVKALRY
jgi:hypothetical protein